MDFTITGEDPCGERIWYAQSAGQWMSQLNISSSAIGGQGNGGECLCWKEGIHNWMCMF